LETNGSQPDLKHCGASSNQQIKRTSGDLLLIHKSFYLSLLRQSAAYLKPLDAKQYFEPIQPFAKSAGVLMFSAVDNILCCRLHTVNAVSGDPQKIGGAASVHICFRYQAVNQSHFRGVGI
jgi:hypothetical protein